MQGSTETDHRQIILGNLAALLFARGVKNLVHAEHDVLESREPREQTGRLEDNATVGTGPGKFLAGQNDAAAAHVVQSRQHREHRALATTGVADERDKLAFPDPEIEILDDDCRPFWSRIDFRQVGQLDVVRHVDPHPLFHF